MPLTHTPVSSSSNRSSVACPSDLVGDAGMVRSSSIDLSDPRVYADARCVFYGGMIRPLVAQSGLDIDDAFQECLVRLLAKQQLPRSRFDPSRSSLRTYLFRVFKSVLLNAGDTSRRRWSAQSRSYLASGHARLRGWSLEVDDVVEDVGAQTWGKRPSVEKVVREMEREKNRDLFSDGSVW